MYIDNTFSEMLRKTKQEVLDLNVLDHCTIEQLKQIESLVTKIKERKELVQKQKDQKIEQKEEQKEEQQQILFLEKKYMAIQNRISEQEKYLAKQKELYLASVSEYKQKAFSYASKHGNSYKESIV